MRGIRDNEKEREIENIATPQLRVLIGRQKLNYFCRATDRRLN